MKNVESKIPFFKAFSWDDYHSSLKEDERSEKRLLTAFPEDKVFFITKSSE